MLLPPTARQPNQPPMDKRVSPSGVRARVSLGAREPGVGRHHVEAQQRGGKW